MNHDIKRTHLARRLFDNQSEYVVECSCGRSFSYARRETAEHQQAQHRKVAEIREQLEEGTAE